jgi:hypothetical protein
MGEEGDLVIVFVSQGPLQAEMAKGMLEAQGIPVMLRYQAIGRVLGLTVDGLGRVDVLVPAACEAAARDVLEESPAPPETPESPST